MHIQTYTPTPQEGRLRRFNRDLQQLSDKYGNYLVQEDLVCDVQYLRNLVVEYNNGSFRAAKELHDCGLELIEKIKNKLHAASTEMQRIDEESPNGKYFTGGKAHDINKAASLSIKAEEHLNQAFCNQNNQANQGE